MEGGKSEVCMMAEIGFFTVPLIVTLRTSERNIIQNKRESAYYNGQITMIII